MTRIIVGRIAHIDPFKRIVDMIDQQPVASGILVESALLDILHHDVVAIVIAIHQFLGLAAFYQRKDAAYLA